MGRKPMALLFALSAFGTLACAPDANPAVSGGIGGQSMGNGGSSTGLGNFSFFVASEAALISLSANAKGFGGDLRYGQTTGIAGADEICSSIAEKSMPGSSAKQWRAFLSVAANGSETAVNAIDRIGAGPWYDRVGRVVSLDVTQLKSDRPAGANTATLGRPTVAPTGFRLVIPVAAAPQVRRLPIKTASQEQSGKWVATAGSIALPFRLKSLPIEVPVHEES